MERRRRILDELRAKGATFADIREESLEVEVLEIEGDQRAKNWSYRTGVQVRGLFGGNWGVTISDDLHHVSSDQVVATALGHEKINIVRLRPARFKWVETSDDELWAVVEGLKSEIGVSKVKLYKERHSKKYLSTEDREIELNWNMFLTELSIGQGSLHKIVRRIGGLRPPSFSELKRIVEEASELIRVLKAEPKKHVRVGSVLMSPESVATVTLHWLNRVYPEPPSELNLEEEVGPSSLEIRDVPVPKEFPTVSPVPVDDEGVEGRELRIVHKGILEEIGTDRYSSAYYGIRPTGNGRAASFKDPISAHPRNIVIECGKEETAISSELVEGEAYMNHVWSIASAGRSLVVTGEGMSEGQPSLIEITLEASRPFSYLSTCSKERRTLPVNTKGLWVTLSTPSMLLSRATD
ncbi:Zn-dependent protease [Sulfodiicoccus acidiphilus]|uniref:Zn-dependent protease n=1 Tax=Sulfodiicoccus acidiphilus TaxID=1670455 RepID=A0A348B0K6_9CREN|nr:metallopeptidase TldD-related protein [Sulfodiicoccus acidiphilus]BBD71708.1 Zn-dependent protease [Sulfodiicoccus acidiphilus]GGT86452.1 Zn-dependent protease [Sulfodiicoccus acidiphilus]